MSEFKFPAVLNEGNGRAVVTAFNAEASEPLFIADEFHPHFDSILKGLRNGDPNVWNLFDVADGVMSRFKEITDRVSWNGKEILWDGDPVHTALASQLERAIQEGDERNYTAIAKFWEKLESNPNAHSREQAYDFLASHQFQITEDGDVVGYKGLVITIDGYRSWHRSTVDDKPSAFVNGNPVEPRKHVYQSIGDVVSMPRSEVHHDPSQPCSRGLHVSTKSYAETYGEVVLVTVNPRDIVSVPDDARGEKVRVCRYKIERLATEGSGSVVLRDNETSPAPRWTGVGYSGI